MSRRYDNLYSDKPVKFQFDIDMIKLDTTSKCWFCQSDTAFFDLRQQVPICSDDCRVLNWQRTVKQDCTGTFKSYQIFYKNGTSKDFGKVRTWFSGDYLYMEQLDTVPPFKHREDPADIAEIKPGEPVS